MAGSRLAPNGAGRAIGNPISHYSLAPKSRNRQADYMGNEHMLDDDDRAELDRIRAERARLKSVDGKLAERERTLMNKANKRAFDERRRAER